MMRFLCKH